MTADPALHDALDQIPEPLLDAVQMAAASVGLTASEWLEQVMKAAVAAQIQDTPQSSSWEETWLGELSRNEELVPITEVAIGHNAAGESFSSLKDELEQIRQLVQDYMSVVEPAIRPIQTLPERMEELSVLADDVRQSADAARKAANSVRPLERTLLRLAGDRKEEPEVGNGARAAGIGRLFRR